MDQYSFRFALYIIVASRNKGDSNCGDIFYNKFFFVLKKCSLILLNWFFNLMCDITYYNFNLELCFKINK